MKLNITRNKSKTISAVIQYYFAIILIATIVINITFLIRENNNINEKMMADIKQYSDNIISYFDENAKLLAHNGHLLLDSKEVREYHIYQEDPYRYNLIRIKDIIHLLNRFIATNKTVVNASIYFVDNNTVISTNGLYNSDLYFKDILVYESLNNYDIRDAANSIGKMNFFPLTNVKLNSKNISYENVFPVIAVYSYSPKVMIIMDMSANLLVDDLYKILPRDEIKFQISDLSSNTFTPAVYGTNSKVFEKEEIKNNIQGQIKVNVDGENRKFIYFNNNSPITNWTYTTYVCTSRYSHLHKKYRLFFLVLITLLVLINIYVYSKFLRRIIFPMKHLGRMDDDSYESEKFPAKIKEFDLIYNKIGGMSSENKLLKSKLTTMIELERRVAIEKILKGYAIDNFHVNNLFSLDSGMNENPFFVVVSLIYFCFNDDITYGEAQGNLHLIISAFNDVFSNNISCYIAETNHNEYGIILKFDDKDQSNTISDSIVNLLSNELCNTPEIIVKCGISSIGNSVNDITKLYNESQVALKDCRVGVQRDLVSFQDVLNKPPRNHKAVINKVRIIGDHMMSDDWDKMEEEVFELINDTYMQEDLRYETLHLLFHELLNIEFYLEFSKKCNEKISTFKTELPYKNVYNLFHSKERFCDMILSYYKIIAFNLVTKIEDNNEVADKVEEILINRYQEDLYLELFSNELGLSARHISRLYKRHYGLSVHERLARIRVEKAKEMLLNSDITVEEIGRLVGIDNKISFGRLFKRIEKIPPGKYRQINKQI